MYELAILACQILYIAACQKYYNFLPHFVYNISFVWQRQLCGAFKTLKHVQRLS